MTDAEMRIVAETVAAELCRYFVLIVGGIVFGFAIRKIQEKLF